MTQIEKVKMGIRVCTDGTYSSCTPCPYHDPEGKRYCGRPLYQDALKVIETLEAKIDHLRAGSSDRPQR